MQSLMTDVLSVFEVMLTEGIGSISPFPNELGLNRKHLRDQQLNCREMRPYFPLICLTPRGGGRILSELRASGRRTAPAGPCDPGTSRDPGIRHVTPVYVTAGYTRSRRRRAACLKCVHRPTHLSRPELAVAGQSQHSHFSASCVREVTGRGHWTGSPDGATGRGHRTGFR